MSWLPVITPEAIAAVFKKDARVVGYALHRSYTGERIKIPGADIQQIVFPVEDVIAWAAINLPGSVNARSTAELRWRAFPVPVAKESAR